MRSLGVFAAGAVILDLPADGAQLLAEGDAVAVARGQELGEPSLPRSFARSA